MVLELIKSINGDCDFTSSIKESSFIEKYETNKEDFLNFLFCILDKYDLILSSSPKDEKNILFKKRIIFISSRLDDDHVNYYDNMGYNNKTMKKKVIQTGLHKSMENKNDKNISSIYYLNDLYKTHFVIVDMNKREYYETTVKNYEKVYLCFKRNKFYMNDSLPDGLTKKEINESYFNIDVRNVYKTYLEPIGKYKISDLKEIAVNMNIQLKINGKNKNKNELYNEINMIHMIN
jgi:hypothetical protein